VGEVDPEISTMELLKRIELRMESLTQELERLPAEKVKIAQRVNSNIYSINFFLHKHFLCIVVIKGKEMFRVL
jgi:hypothetical protein